MMCAKEWLRTALFLYHECVMDVSLPYQWTFFAEFYNRFTNHYRHDQICSVRRRSRVEERTTYVMSNYICKER